MRFGRLLSAFGRRFISRWSSIWRPRQMSFSWMGLQHRRHVRKGTRISKLATILLPIKLLSILFKILESNTPKVMIKVWQSIEVNGFVFVWNHSKGDQPNWWPKSMNQLTQEGYSFKDKCEHQANCHIQVIVTMLLVSM